MKTTAMLLLTLGWLLSGCSALKPKAVPMISIMPPTTKMQPMRQPAASAPAPKAADMVFGPIVYPSHVEKYVWYVEASTDLVHWVEVVGPITDDYSQKPCDVPALSPGHTFYRMRGDP